MAARGHVQDPNDRRLRPIYDYLDNGNNKMAVQQADKLLKKHKDLHCAKVLKAIGLQRTGKQEEAFSLAQEVATLEPTDDNSLQALTILYREMHRPELVTKLYESAVRKVPSSEEYHSHLFMAYARVGEYKKMQQVGMALYKIVPKNPYYFWSVMSLVMQAISAQDEKLSQTMFLPLAERMVEKMVKEDKMEAEAEVQLYFMILERLGKYVEALELVRGQLGEMLTSELQGRESKSLMLYRRLERWPECNALSLRLLLKNPDDWQFYLSYYDSLFYIMDQGWTPPDEGEHCVEGEVQYAVAHAIRFVEERVSAEEAKESRPLRGPYLARLELIGRLRGRGCPEEQQLGDPLELMFQYFVKFGEKPCCITDLKIYLELLNPEQHMQFINRLMETVPLLSPGEEPGGVAVPGDTRALQRHLCVAQLSRALGLQHALEPSGKLALIQELKARYRHGLQFGRACLKTELQFSDMYCLMAAHVYIDLWEETGDPAVLWQCLGLLEEGLVNSPSNAQFKLLLILLFCRLGAFEPVVDLYSGLDAKHVQHDTIGYLLTRYAVSLGQFAAAAQSCNFSLRFFHSNQKDTSEYIIQAYKYGAFEKIPEFIGFRTRLNRSLHFAQVRTESMLLDLLLEADISSSLQDSVRSLGLCPEEQDIPWGELRDNRDLTVLTSWDPKTRQLSEEQRLQSLEEESLWLRLRSLTLRLVSSLANLGHHPAPRNSEKTAENGLATKPDVFRPLLAELDTTLTGRRPYPFLGPPSSRLGPALSSGACQCQASAFHLAAHLQELDTSGLEESAEVQTQIRDGLTSLTEQLQEMLNKCKGELLEAADTQCRAQPSLLENLVCFTEPPVFSGFQEFASSMAGVLSRALDHIKEQEASLTALKLSSLSLQEPAVTQDEGKMVGVAMEKVQSSYLRSLQEVKELLRKRTDTLRNLKI
ncbi:hypothetical protein ANANG_G00186860 [Anguilla anguilla]|uniref:N-alpha-acetyltransferase 25, NatB auxiliary subunit n=1 Tax=Anguilla anguilla TaxID=7936 RepID=A0A9D3RR72_ANGAN|nr:hypothetical protein ANANG_G00186860 [Anguilla anguilla]